MRLCVGRGGVVAGCCPPLRLLPGLSAWKPASACGEPRRDACRAVTAGSGGRRRAGLACPPGVPLPQLFTSSARNVFPPGLRAVLPGSCSPVSGMRRGLHHMAGGTKTFLQGKIIMSQPHPPTLPRMISYRHISPCLLAVSRWGVEGDGGWHVPRSWLCRAEGLAALVPVSSWI